MASTVKLEIAIDSSVAKSSYLIFTSTMCDQICHILQCFHLGFDLSLLILSICFLNSI